MIPARPTDGNSEGREKICWKCGRSFHTDIEVCPDDGSRLLELTSEDRKDPLIGTLFDGRFRMFHKLGEGGMGAVYSARKLDADSDVALKLLKGDFARDEGIRKRFFYEAHTISNLQHPNSVKFYDFGQTTDGHFYMVMELLRGESLAERLAHRFVSYQEVFAIIPPICGALGEAHTREVIHRDLKPENIFLQRISENQEIPKLLDFGIAKHHGIATMTQSGTLWGTPAYMSPEQARGDVIGPRADIYGIGIMLYELISGNLPFHATTQMGFAVKHINEPVRSLLSIPGLSSVPAELDDFVLKLLSKDPEQRPETMNEVATTLLSIRERLFDDELLEKTPATEVDPVGLKEWLKSADGSQPFKRIDSDSTSFVRTAGMVQTLSVFPLPSEIESVQSGQDFETSLPVKNTSFSEGAEKSVKRTIPRIWIGAASLVGIALILFAWSVLRVETDVTSMDPSSMNLSQVDYLAVEKAASEKAYLVIVLSRDVVRDIVTHKLNEEFRPSDERYLTIVDDPQTDNQNSATISPDSEQKKSVKPVLNKKRRTLKEALEKTF